MALSQRIELRQRPSLVMTPQLQQGIKLLQMSNLELAEFVAAEVEKNPLLELAPSVPPGPRGGGPGGTGGMEAVAARVSLTDVLFAQIGVARAGPEILEAARIVAEELDDDGYLRAPVAEVAARHRLGAAAVLRGLDLVQGCEPAGVGARDLRECLSLQLRERDRFDPAMQALLDNLGLAARGRRAELERICGVDASDLADMFDELRALDPKPGLRFSQAIVQVAAPDVYVTRAGGGDWIVELNTQTLPRALVNNRYAARLGPVEGEARRFLSEMSASANWLVRSLERRARTILLVATDMVRHQEGFLTSGPRMLRPLTQRIVAKRLGLHESTISRVTSGKWFSCEQGNFELRYMFSVALPSGGEGEAVSAVAVQERIRRMILEETGRRPLSDDKIVCVLNREGIDIARRTVAKYREGMGIPSSVQRRRDRSVLSGM